MTNAPSLHIVRRYGQVGGMENYVWELTHGLQALGQPVTVVCEQCLGPVHNGIDVFQTGSIKSHPRWLSMLRFSHRVSKVTASLNLDHTIVHSHERTAIHDVTTFHGPSILNRKKSWVDKLSPRLWSWEYLEKREVASSNVKCVIPNSIPVGDNLKNAYPQIAHLIHEPMYPGVNPDLSKIVSRSNGKTVGFVGREWKRKGLGFACEIVSKLQTSDPEVQFVIAGCEHTDIKHLFDNWNGHHEILGWVEPATFFEKIDLLIHPALHEPFGMVIAEANAAGIPVVISTECGISPLIGNGQGKVVDLKNPDKWLGICKEYLTKKRPVVPLTLSWVELAKSHANLYTLMLENKSATDPLSV